MEADGKKSLFIVHTKRNNVFPGRAREREKEREIEREVEGERDRK